MNSQTAAVNPNSKEPSDSRNALLVLGFAMLVGLLTVVVYAAHTGGTSLYLSIIGIGVLLTGASAFGGGTLGFLFGIPRTSQPRAESQSPDGTPHGSKKETSGSGIRYSVNTNLEEISDWLTKILVGVTLTQVAEIRHGLGVLTRFAAKGLGSQEQAQVFALALLLYFSVLGFFFGYLWTRLFLTKALVEAEQDVISSLSKKVQKAHDTLESTAGKIDAFEKKAEQDSKALQLVYQQLNPSSSIPEVTQEALDAAVAAASRSVRIQIFYQTAEIRSDTWRNPDTKPRMERTIPVFRALINNDAENRYHMNHGQLGFALKDKLQPQWAEAEKELSTAIALRNKSGETGWLLYEFNRALCRISLDAEFKANRGSNPDLKNQILGDLRLAAGSEKIRKIMESEIMEPEKVASDGTLQKWFSVNSMKLADLCSG